MYLQLYVIIYGFLTTLLMMILNLYLLMQLIMEHLSDAKDVGKLMRGEQADLPDSHPHSKYAFRMLQQFRIGRVSDYRR